MADTSPRRRVLPGSPASVVVSDDVPVEHPQRRDRGEHEIAIPLLFSHGVAEQVQVVQVLQSTEDVQSALEVLELVAGEAKLLQELEVDERAAIESPAETGERSCH